MTMQPRTGLFSARSASRDHRLVPGREVTRAGDRKRVLHESPKSEIRKAILRELGAR